jgi:pyrroline-5-carboxylate reductase
MPLDRKIAVIGAGNLGAALLEGLLRAGAVEPDALMAADPSKARLAESRKSGVRLTASDNRKAAEFADILVLAVKPHLVAPVVESIAAVLRPGQLVISLAAAVPIRAIEAALGGPRPIVRAMPNIALTVGASATALCANARASAADRKAAEAIFATVGEVVFVEESQMHAVTGLSGSGPAYALTLIEALAAGGVRMGLTPAVATRLAAQTLLGAAKLVLESGEHPAALRDQVTTPGGTTIAGLHEIELGGVRGALMSAVQSATERSMEIAQMLGHDED